jgi:Nitrile hydratase beta subunit
VIPIDTDGALAPPRSNGELVFAALWQARAFGLAIALLEGHHLGWDAFRRHLLVAIEEHAEATYYEQFVDALAALAEEMAAGEMAGQAGRAEAGSAGPQLAVEPGVR